MQLNTIKPAEGEKSNRKRVGRGIGSGWGKTSGKGHKGQKARSGGSIKVGFEGGQMPLQRRLPKFGFTSRKSLYRDEVRLNELNDIDSDVIDLDALKKHGIISNNVKMAKVILSGEVKKAVKLKGLGVTAGAKKAIESAGGAVE